MPNITSSELPRPKNWDELEFIVWSLFKRIWKGHATRHGRSGQRQQGVDIYGQNQELQWEGVQVKGKTSRYGHKVTARELMIEVTKAKAFEPALKHFILATSVPRDAAIQHTARSLSVENSALGLFSVHVWGWEDVEERIQEYPDLVRLHWPDMFKAGVKDVSGPLEHLSQQMREQAKWVEERERPRFICEKVAVSRGSRWLVPEFTIEQSPGASQKVIDVWLRFRGAKFRTEWEHVSGSSVGRRRFSRELDLDSQPRPDDLVKEDEMGLEITFHWQRQWRRELHRWLVVCRQLAGGTQWDLGEKLPPTLYFDDGAQMVT